MTTINLTYFTYKNICISKLVVQFIFTKEKLYIVVHAEYLNILVTFIRLLLHLVSVVNYLWKWKGTFVVHCLLFPTTCFHYKGSTTSTNVCSTNNYCLIYWTIYILCLNFNRSHYQNKWILWFKWLLVGVGIRV